MKQFEIGQQLLAGGGNTFGGQFYHHSRQASLESQRSSETGSLDSSRLCLQVPWFARPVPELPAKRQVTFSRHHQQQQQPLKASKDMYRPGLYTEDEVEMYPMMCGDRGREHDLLCGEHDMMCGGDMAAAKTRLHHTRSGGYGNEMDLPQDPRLWSRDEVCSWVVTTCTSHNLPAPNTDRFLMNGKAVCLMSLNMFISRVPLGGKLLYRDFQIRLGKAIHE